MARLIDADDIIETDFEYIPEKYVNFLKDTVNQWPTVEAIPKEWIKDWLGKCKWCIADVEDMLEDWGKENGVS